MIYNIDIQMIYIYQLIYYLQMIYRNNRHLLWMVSIRGWYLSIDAIHITTIWFLGIPLYIILVIKTKQRNPYKPTSIIPNILGNRQVSIYIYICMYIYTMDDIIFKYMCIDRKQVRLPSGNQTCLAGKSPNSIEVSIGVSWQEVIYL